MLEFLAGLGVIALPRGNLLLLASIAAAKGAASLRRRRRNHEGRQLPRQPAVDPDATSTPAASTAPERPITAAYDAKVTAVDLAWRRVSVVLRDPKKGTSKQILHDVSGSAKAGRLLALMGPSGSGKTTLLTALAGQLGRNPNLVLQGEVTVNGEPYDTSSHRQAFVEQANLFFSMLSVEETLEVAAQLQLPGDMPEDERVAYVSRLVNILGLSKVTETVVGDEKVRGLSGGERKRLAIGCELISSPSLIFLDEPTTGLDAFQAERVMATLKHLANAGHTVVCSIHQPRSSIFAMFDDLLMLSEGRVVYAGAADAMLNHFERLGHVCPEHYNPAEFGADLISIDFTSSEAEVATRTRTAQLAAAWEAAHAAAPPAPASGAAPPPEPAPRPAGWRRQFRLLLQRSWRQITRDRASARARLASNLSSALIFGAIFFRMGRKQSSIQDRLGLLQVAAINTAMSALVKTLYVFPTERAIVGRERARGAYSVLPYLSAKLLAELPVSAVFPLVFGGVVYPLTGLNARPIRLARFLGILTLESFTAAALGLAVGAAAPSTEAAVAIGPAVMLVFIVFGGFYVNADNVPRVLRWVPSTSLIKAAFEALAVNEFTGLEFQQDAAGQGMRTGGDVLHWLSLDRGGVPCAMLREARILAAFYWITYSILKAKKPSFQQMGLPGDGSSANGNGAVGSAQCVVEVVGGVEGPGAAPLSPVEGVSDGVSEGVAAIVAAVQDGLEQVAVAAEAAESKANVDVGGTAPDTQ